MLRVLRHEKVDRLPICPVGLSPFTWHKDFPAYSPVLGVAARHCEFMPVHYLSTGINYCHPSAIGEKTELEQHEDGRKIKRSTIRTPRGDLTAVQIHDPNVGSWAYFKPYIQSEEELILRENLPFEPCEINIEGLKKLAAATGDAGLPYINGIRDALNSAVWGMGEEFRVMFCFTEQERLRKMVDRAQERILNFVSGLLKAGAGPVFRLYAIEDFVEPLMPPSFVDKFIVPYDRELVKLIHDHGCYVVMHCHGRLSAQIERMVAIGVDGVDCAESPPQNDIDLAGMIAKADGRMFIWGYIQFEELARRTGDEIEAMVRDAIEQGGSDGRYVLSQAASPWTGDFSERTRENWIRMIEAGVKYGNH
jgi:hypothetical protein